MEQSLLAHVFTVLLLAVKKVLLKPLTSSPAAGLNQLSVDVFQTLFLGVFDCTDKYNNHDMTGKKQNKTNSSIVCFELAYGFHILHITGNNNCLSSSL